MSPRLGSFQTVRQAAGSTPDNLQAKVKLHKDLCSFSNGPAGCRVSGRQGFAPDSPSSSPDSRSLFMALSSRRHAVPATDSLQGRLKRKPAGCRDCKVSDCLKGALHKDLCSFSNGPAGCRVSGRQGFAPDRPSSSWHSQANDRPFLQPTACRVV